MRDRAEYEQLFDGATTERAIGEATPNYLHAPEAAAWIAAELPDAKIIVSLRNPADGRIQVISGGCGAASKSGQSKLPCSREITSSIPACTAMLWRPFFAQFDRSRVKVLLFDDLARDSAAALRDLCAFLDIAPHAAIDTKARHNVGFMPKWAAADAIAVRGATVARNPRNIFGCSRSGNPRNWPRVSHNHQRPSRAPVLSKNPGFASKCTQHFHWAGEVSRHALDAASRGGESAGFQRFSSST